MLSGAFVEMHPFRIHIMKLLDRYIIEPICLLVSFFYRLKTQRQDLKRAGSILLIKLWGLGNMVLLAPIAEGFKARYDGAEIYLLTLGLNRQIAGNLPFFKKVYYVRPSVSVFNLAAEFLRHLVSFRKMRVGLLVNFEILNRASALFGLFSGAGRRFGFKIDGSSANHFYTGIVNVDANTHTSRNYCSLAASAGVLIENYRYFNPLKAMPAGLLKNYKTHSHIVAMHIGSGANFTGKRWKNANFAKLADMLISEHNCKVIFTGTGAEAGLIEDTINKMKYRQADNFCDRFSIAEFCQFLSGCRLFVSNDTGPLHLAAAAGVNTAAFYGPTSPLNYRNLNANSACFYKPTKCSPCLTHLNGKTSLCRSPVCLDRITPEEAFFELSKRFF